MALEDDKGMREIVSAKIVAQIQITENSVTGVLLAHCNGLAREFLSEKCEEHG
jgi:hypothetical protein